MSQTQPSVRKTSPILLAFILIMLVLSVTAIYQAAAMVNNQEISAALNFLILGAVGIALSAYLLFQTRRRMRIVSKTQRVVTTITCQKCGFKTVRDFQRGDYVLKEAEACPKCSEKMLIASVYREVDEKEKKEEKRF